MWLVFGSTKSDPLASLVIVAFGLGKTVRGQPAWTWPIILALTFSVLPLHRHALGRLDVVQVSTHTNYARVLHASGPSNPRLKAFGLRINPPLSARLRALWIVLSVPWINDVARGGSARPDSWPGFSPILVRLSLVHPYMHNTSKTSGTC